MKGANGIDPGHIATPDGKRYLFVNKGRMAPLNEEGTALTDTLRTVHKGWPIPKHWITEGGWPLMHLESPKLVRHGDYYYLISAEGGTAGPATSHMAVVARSHSLEGPWEESPYNPIIHTYSATDQWWSKGHATLIDDVNGNWWMVYHAYANGYHSLGRQTLIEPVAWTADGWLKPVAKQPLPKAETPIEPLSLSDDFQSPTLGLQWVMYREYEPKAITVGGGVLRLRGKGTTPATARYLLTTAEDKGYDVTADVTVGGKAAFAGLMLYYNDKHFSGISTNGKVYEVYHQGQLLKTVRNSFGKRSVIRLRNLGQKLTAQVSRDGKEWQTLVENIDLSQMNHNQLRGFLALRPALMAAGDSESLFRNFTYTAHNTDEKHMAAYLMVYHKDEDHGLHMAISHDGYSFTALNGDKPVISGDTISEQHGIRDPHIYRARRRFLYVNDRPARVRQARR